MAPGAPLRHLPAKRGFEPGFVHLLYQIRFRFVDQGIPLKVGTGTMGVAGYDAIRHERMDGGIPPAVSTKGLQAFRLEPTDRGKTSGGCGPAQSVHAGRQGPAGGFGQRPVPAPGMTGPFPSAGNGPVIRQPKTLQGRDSELLPMPAA